MAIPQIRIVRALGTDRYAFYVNGFYRGVFPKAIINIKLKGYNLAPID